MMGSSGGIAELIAQQKPGAGLGKAPALPQAAQQPSLISQAGDISKNYQAGVRSKEAMDKRRAAKTVASPPAEAPPLPPDQPPPAPDAAPAPAGIAAGAAPVEPAAPAGPEAGIAQPPAPAMPINAAPPAPAPAQTTPKDGVDPKMIAPPMATPPDIVPNPVVPPADPDPGITAAGPAPSGGADFQELLGRLAGVFGMALGGIVDTPPAIAGNPSLAKPGQPGQPGIAAAVPAKSQEQMEAEMRELSAGSTGGASGGGAAGGDAGGPGGFARGGQAGTPHMPFGRRGAGSRGGTSHFSEKGGGLFRGPVEGSTPGRSDQRTTSVGRGSYVVPADVVSGLGAGNTAAGFKHLAGPIGKRGPIAYAQGGQVPVGAGTAGGDAVPVRLSDGEFVYSPEEVAALGDGDPKAGAAKLDRLVHSVRAATADTMKRMPPPR